jgi:hypothetical protein
VYTSTNVMLLRYQEKVMDITEQLR